VTHGGKEMSFAQVIQAWAAGAEPIPEMNPVCLKPKGDSLSQVIVLGEHYADRSAGNYYDSISEMSKVLEKALKKLEEQYDVIVMEGAGGAAEINLYDRDIVNVGTARLTQAPILLVGDIERGGVFASLYGTVMLLPEDVKKNIKGIIINKFRGDPKILEPGLKQLEELTGIPILGVMPYFRLRIPSEDSMAFQEKEGSGSVPAEKKERQTGLEIAIIQFSKISHFNDFEILESKACVRYVDVDEKLETPDLIILPGTTIPFKDLEALQKSGMAQQIKAVAGTIPIIGIGEGYQILGKKLTLPSGETVDGLGLLDCETIYAASEGYSEKPIRICSKINECGPIFSSIEGEEILGFTSQGGIVKTTKPIFGTDGACSQDGLVIGTSFHGLF
jgi:adenosylcobyric acid synthase